MKLSRRNFLKATGIASLLGVSGVPRMGRAQDKAAAQKPKKIQYATESTTICPYCGVGCGLIVHAKDGAILNIEGDPDHPINEGALCSKGASIIQLHNNERRATKVLHRAPNAADWEEWTWDQAMSRIVELVKNTRDENWLESQDGTIINRAEGIACLGGAALDTEECYLLVKFMRGLGVTWLEHQARI